MDSRRLFSILAINILLAGGVLYYLYATGYWSDQNKALRYLHRVEIPATPEQVSLSVAEGDLDTLALLRTAGVDLNAEGARNAALDYPLHAAAKANDWQTYQFLVQQGANPNLPNAHGLPISSLLLEQGHHSRAALLFKQGAEVNIPHASGEPYLIHAINQQEESLIELLLSHGADPATKSTVGHPALYHAYAAKSHHAMQLLLQAGADPNITVPHGTPLFPYLCKTLPTQGYTTEQEAALVQQFVAKGASTRATDSSGWRALQWLIHHDRLSLADPILAKDPDLTNILWVALKLKNYPVVVSLLERGVNPSELTGTSPHTPLHFAIHENQSTLITALLDSGADPEQKGAEGQSALITALTLKHEDAAMALLQHPTSPANHSATMNYPISKSFRALYSDRGYFDWHCQNVPGITPLMVAVMQGLFTPAEQLILNGANRTQGTQSRSKIYPIQMAAKRKDVKMQQLLIGVPYQDDQQVRNFIIDLSEQKVYYYREGKLIKTSRISSGRRGYRTEPGYYVITDKIKNKRSNLYDDAPMPYFQRFSCTAIGFHEGNTYSSFASHGCIRLPMSTAKYFWGETSLGDRVQIRK